MSKNEERMTSNRTYTHRKNAQKIAKNNVQNNEKMKNEDRKNDMLLQV